MLKSPKVAIPAAAATGIVPWSTPPDGLLPITSDTFPVNPVAVLPKPSRAITLTAGIVAPACVALGCTVNASLAAAAGVIVNAALGAVSDPAVACSVYPAPALSIERSANVATPATAATVFVPDSVPPCVFVPSVITTSPVKPVTVLPWGSSAVTCTAGAIGAPAVVLPGGTVKTSWLPARATRKSGSLSALSPNATQALVPPPWSTARACQWYAVASLRPPTAALPVAPLATAAPEPLTVPVKALPTGPTSHSSPIGDPPGGPGTGAVSTTYRLRTSPPRGPSRTPPPSELGQATGRAGSGAPAARPQSHWGGR